MKNNGIVRRLDELGRIVIPKELRRTMRLKDGDELEIAVNGDMLSLRKYSDIEAIEPAAKSVAALLVESTGADVLFVNSSKVELADGAHKSVYSGAKLSEKFSEIISSRRACVLHGEDVLDLFENLRYDCCYIVLEPILTGGDLAGTLALFLDTMPSDVARAYLHFAAELLAAILS